MSGDITGQITLNGLGSNLRGQGMLLATCWPSLLLLEMWLTSCDANIDQPTYGEGMAPCGFTRQYKY